MDEERLRSCCFTGHRPAKLDVPEREVRKWLEEKISEAAADGYMTFITGCAMGVDLWAGLAVLEKKAAGSGIRLVAASPWPGAADRWDAAWKRRYDEILHGADEVVQIGERYSPWIYQLRNAWMVDHSRRLIAWYNDAPGGTLNTILYADRCGLEIVQRGMEKGKQHITAG